MIWDLLLALLVALTFYLLGYYIKTNRKLNLIASIEPERIPKEKETYILNSFYKTTILGSITIFFTILIISHNEILGLLFFLILIIELLFFYHKYNKIKI